MKRTLFILLFVAATLPMWADSPLTSTHFWRIYNTGSEIVFPLYKVVDADAWSDRVKAVLVNPDISVEQRLCVVNYLGWDINGQKHYDDLLNYYVRATKKSDRRAAIREMDGQMLAVFAYVKAMDDYFDVKEAKRLSAEAVKRAPKSRAVAMTDALIGAQIAMDSNWGEVYRICKRVVDNKRLENDFCDPAVVAIMEYIDLYAEY